MFRIIVLLSSMLLLLATGCETKPDRLVTADGRVLSGRLESIEGRHVGFSNGEATLEFDEGRVYLLKDGTTYRGLIRYSGDDVLVETSSGSVEIPLDKVSMIIWSDPSMETSVLVDVPAAEGWISSGISLTEQERLILHATGTVSVETGSCGPAGIDYFSTAMALVPGATNGQLVMRVGECTPVAAGSTWTGDSPGSGELFLAVNRPDRTSTAGVGGEFTVRVIRTPGILNNSVLYPAPR